MEDYAKYLSHGRNKAHQRPSPYSRQLTCRLCGRVVLSDQAMLTHIEMHMAQEDASRTRPDEQFPPINQPPNLLNIIPPRPHNNIIVPNPSIQPNFPPPPLRPFFPGPVVAQYHAAMRPGSNNISLTLGNRSTQINIISRPPNMLPPQVSPPAIAQAQQSVMAVTHGEDICRPFLRLLERPIPKVLGFVDLDEENVDDNLDLTLKL